MAPLRWSRDGLFARKPLSLTNLDMVPGTVALVIVIIGTTSFDGFSGGPAWSNIAPELTNVFRDLGFGQATALELAFTVGLVVVTLIVAGLYALVSFDGDGQVATRSQYWMLVVMIAFTSLGLWLLSAANSRSS